MIVVARSCKAAAAVAAATGGTVVLRVKTDRATGAQTLVPGRSVDLGDLDLAGFEAFRQGVESAAGVLYELRDGPGEDAAVLDNGWQLRGAKFEVQVSDPAQERLISSHFGARRFAYNWVIAAVKGNLAARREDPAVPAVSWSSWTLRNQWNGCKQEVAPWWRENSKECYAAGISDAAAALKNWSQSKNGSRKGRRVGFPGLKSKRRDAERIRFTTGGIRLEADRRTIVLPVIGALRSKQNTRHVQRPLASGQGHLFSLTLSRRWGRLFVSVSYAVRKPSQPAGPARPEVTAGVDLGLRDLATVTDTDGVTTVFPAPRPLRETMAERRRVARSLSRRIPGSRGYESAKAKLTRLDRRAVHLRGQAMHELTTWLTRCYGRVVVEDLDLAAMKRSMGRRAYRRAVSDTALGRFRPMLAYKAEAGGTVVVVADRWYPSSQIHHGCGCRLHAEHKLDKYLTCLVTGERVDRDVNASKNLRDWPDSQRGPVGATDPFEKAAPAA